MKIIYKLRELSGERIVVLGLGHPGKTSIIQVFQGKTPQEVLTQEIPLTKGLNIDKIIINKREVDIIDLGGNILHMVSWIVRLESWLQNCIVLIYVVDPSSADNIEKEKTKKYFQKTIACKSTVCPNAKMYLFLHCTDKLTSETKKSELDEMETFFKEGITEPFTIYQTTLQDYSVSKAFTDICTLL